MNTTVEERFLAATETIFSRYSHPGKLIRLADPNNIELSVRITRTAQATENPIASEISAENIRFKVPMSDLTEPFLSDPIKKGDRIEEAGKHYTIREAAPAYTGTVIALWNLTCIGGNA